MPQSWLDHVVDTRWIYDPDGDRAFYQVKNYIYDPTGTCKYRQNNNRWYTMDGGQAAYYVQDDWIYTIQGQPKFQYKQISATSVWD